MSVEAALRLLQGSQRLRRPVAVITFDDGYRSVFEHARPILAEHRVPACCFVSTDLVDTDRRFDHDSDNPALLHLEIMSWKELSALRGEGWGIGGHSASHARLSMCSPEKLAQELERPVRALKEHLDLSHVAMAYPFGGPADITARGLALARSVPGADDFTHRRIDIGGDHNALAWKLWAHGIELRRWRRT